MTGDRTRRWPPEENCYCGGPEWTLYPHRRGTGLYCRRDAAEPAATMDHTPDPRLSELVARAVNGTCFSGCREGR